MVVLRRLGGPPLRFAGRAPCASRDRDLSVRIWQAKTGGFVLAHSVEAPGAEAADMKLDLRSAGRLHVADLLEDLARLSDWRRRFRVLA
jgi:hypothetical protein